MKKRRIGRLGLAVVLVGGALAYLVVVGTRQNLTYYYEVEELLAAAADAEGKIRISGDVVPGSIVRDPATRELGFAIESTTATGPDARTIPVVYAGTVPDIFKDGIQVVVEGRLDPDGTFRAETLLAKCPSKYQAAGELGSS